MIMVLPGERFILHMQVYPKRQTGRTAHSQHCIRIMADGERTVHTIDVRKSYAISSVSRGVHTAMVHM